MNSKNVAFTLIIVLLIATNACAQSHAPSFKNGDPPPASAMALSVPQARAALREAVKTRFVGTVKSCLLFACSTAVLSTTTDFRLSAGGFSWVAPYTLDNQPNPGNLSVRFKGEKNIGYVQAFKVPLYSCAAGSCYNVGYLPKPVRQPIQWYILEWSDEITAQRFSDAFNRLLYAAFHSEGESEFATFSAAAKTWRENPTKPPLGPEADRHRILAENAIQEKNLDSAIDHYESAVEVQPMWPEGWFNLGMLYAEQNDFADAADRMKHYLELLPDAPDAQAAHTNMIIWEDKATKE